MTGGRFDGDGMPVEALVEIVAYEQLVVGVAKELFRREHASRQRLPRGFSERLQLRLETVERGSAVPVLERVRESGMLMSIADEFTRSRDLIEEAVLAVAEGGALPEAFPRGAVVLFNQFGRTLQQDEAIELRRGTARSGPRYTQAVRRQIVLGERRTFQDEVSDIGWVLEIDSGRMTCMIRLRSAPQARTIPAPVDEVTFDQLKEAMEPNGNGPPLHLTGIGVFDTRGYLYRLDSIQDVSLVEDPESLEALDSRIAELRELQHGWLDGDGVPPTPAALQQASIVLAEQLTPDVPRPRVYPTPDGGVQAEWAMGGYEINLTIDPDGRGHALAVNLDSGESRDLENGDTKEIAQFLQQAS